MKTVIKILIVAFIFRFVLAFITWHIDVANHMDWGIRFWQYGANKFYAPESNVWSFTWPNQPPGTILMFAGIRKLYEFIFSVLWYVNIKVPAFPSVIITFAESRLYPALLKLPAILSDLGIGMLIYKIIKNYRGSSTIRGVKASQAQLATSEVFPPEIAGLIFWLVNPIVWYNSAVWGQTDAVINFLALLAFYWLIQRKLLFAVLAMTFCLYFKASLLIFLPIFVIMIIRQKYHFMMHVHSVLVTLFFVGLTAFIFSHPKEPYIWLFNLYKEKVFINQMQVVTANAFNLWAVVSGLDQIPHTLNLGPITYQTWGEILLAIAYIPVLVLVYKKQDMKTVSWALTITAFSSFMLLTNMHERYLYPIFPVLTVLAVLDRRLLPFYFGISVINFVNLYNMWWVPRSESLVSFLTSKNWLVPRVLSFVNIVFFILVYRKFLTLFPRFAKEDSRQSPRCPVGN